MSAARRLLLRVRAAPPAPRSVLSAGLRPRSVMSRLPGQVTTDQSARAAAAAANRAATQSDQPPVAPVWALA